MLSAPAGRLSGWNMTSKFARPYLVTFYAESEKTSGLCVPRTLEEWAYTAQDARLQVEIQFEGREPRDPYFRVIKIEPKWLAEARA